MEILGNLLDGFMIAFQPLNIGLILFGCLLGILIGAMPGLGSVNGVAILLPMTFLVPPGGAIIFLAAIYYGAMYGGAISSIMIGIPGCSTAVATTFDGRPLAMQGFAERALVVAALASFVGGTISLLLFTSLAPPLASVALAFGSPEIFALMLLAFSTFIGLGGDDIPKTLISIFLGLVLSTVGLDVISGQPRLIFGDLPGFYHGINFLVLAIGVYGIGEMLLTIETNKNNVYIPKIKSRFSGIVDGIKQLRHNLKPLGIGSIIGYFVGILPAAGATPGALMAYGVSKMLAKDPDSYGKGNIGGVAAPESANNAASTGSMLPMLTLGIPGSPTTAILLGGMVIWGLEPGPLLFTEQKEFVWGLVASLYASNLFALLLNLSMIPLFIRVLRLPFTILAPLIFVICIVSGYVATQSMHDVWLILVFGIVGYLMRKLGYPMAPLVLAIVLGPLAEPALRQTLIISNGSAIILFERPISGPIMVIALVLLVLPFFKVLKKIMRNKSVKRTTFIDD